MKITCFLKSIFYNLNIRLIHFLVLSLMVTATNQSLAQVLQGPGPEWIKEERNPVDWLGNLDKNKVSDEWWYAHTNIYDANGQHIGYAACGYATWPDASVSLASQNNCFSKTPITFPLPLNGGDYSCEPFESKDETRGPLFQTLARYDLQGNMVWCKRFNENTFLNVIQDSQDQSLVAIGITSYVNDPSGSPILYHSTVNGAGTALSCNATNQYEYKMNVVKVDLSGNQVYNKIYGNQSFSSNQWEREQSYGTSLAEYNGGYRLVGRTTNDNLYTSTAGANAFMVQTDRQGVVLSKQIYRYGASMEFFDITVGNNGNLLVSGNQISGLNQSGFVHFFPSTASNTPNSSNFQLVNPSTNTQWNNSRISFITYLSNYNVFAVPVLYNNQYLPWRGWNGDAAGQVVFYANDFNPSGSFPAPINFGNFLAYDLKV